jgi:hypothetical protein
MMDDRRIAIHTVRALLAGFLLCALCAACTERGVVGGREHLRDLPPEMIRHIISGDDSAFAWYGREVGIVVLMDAAKKLNERMREAVIAGREREALSLIEDCKPIARVLDGEYDYNLYLDGLNYYEDLSSGDRRSLIRLESDYYSFRSEIHLPPRQKLERYMRFLDAFERWNDVLYIALSEYEISYAYGALGDAVKRLRYLRAASRHFEECGLHEMTCATLYELGEHHEKAGDADSMIVYFEAARRVARRSHLPWESAQISALYARHYARHGRLALAYDLLNEAMELCRRYKGEYSELEFVVETMRFQAEIGCWEIVERLLERARVLQRRYAGRTKSYIKLYALQIDRLEARALMARGDVDGAESIFRRTGEAIDDLIMPYTQEPEHAKLCLHRARGLLDNGRSHEALDVIADGLRRLEKTPIAPYPARLAVLEAKAAFDIGEMGRCERALRRFEEHGHGDGTSLRREWMERDALLGAMKLRSGDREAAVHAFESGMRRLEQYAMLMDASVQSYLWIDELRGLRTLMHDCAAPYPAMGYGAELHWLGLHRSLGRRARSFDGIAAGRNVPDAERDRAGGGEADGSLLKMFRRRAEAVRDRVAGRGAVHCVYAVHGDGIVRWTASRAGIRREVVEVPTGEVRAHITRAWKMMSGKRKTADAGVPSELHGTLRSLARLLLPEEMLRARSAGPFFITAGGFLGLIPFETFDVGTGDEYIPLLMHHDVAYLRHADRFGGPGEGPPGVILVNEKPSKELLKRYPFQSELEAVIPEGETVAALNPGARLLVGDSASKSNLISAWEDASFIYMAAHMLRDPQVPYLMLIPLAPAAEPAGPDAAYLDVTDIRAADFRACRLVILSGCSSGAPYLEARIAGPSLADVFLDAGAGAVVHTFWDVPDREARRLMTSYVRTWGNPDFSRVRALCDIRRAAFQSPRPDDHPFGWASYGIKIGRW